MHRELSLGFEHSFAHALVFVETVLGGDPLNSDGKFRHFVDAYYSGRELPRFYYSPEAQAIRTAATTDAPHEVFVTAVKSFLEKHGLTYSSALDDLIYDCGSDCEPLLARFDPMRREHIKNILDVGNILLRIQLHDLGLSEHLPLFRLPSKAPAYDEIHATVYGEKPVIYDITGDHQKLTKLLREQGFEPSHHQGLLGAIQAWRSAHPVDVGNLESIVRNLRSEALLLVQTNVAPHLPSHDHLLDGLEFVPVADTWFSGSSNYFGVDHTTGEHHFKGTFQFNTDTIKLGMSLPELKLLLLHENIPGHHLDNVTTHHEFLQGRVGFEWVIPTMLTPDVSRAEGLANVAPLLAYGVTTEDDLPDKDLQIAYVLARLVDKAKNNASYMVRVEDRKPDDVQVLLELEYFVNQNLAYRLAHKWAANPLVAGTYAPAYGFGTRVAEAIIGNIGLEQGIHYLYGVHGKPKCDIRQLKRAFYAATIGNTNYRVGK